MKQYNLIIDNIECGKISFDSFDIGIDETLYGVEIKIYKELYLFVEGKIIYHLENKREIEVFETCKKIYVDSY